MSTAYDDLAKAVGNCIRANRIEKGFTLEELGEKIGVTKATIQRYESGSIKKIKPDKLQPLADALGISVLELLPIHYASKSHLDKSAQKKASIKSLVLEVYGMKFLELIDITICLTSEGQEKLIERAKELLEIPRYNLGRSEYEADAAKDRPEYHGQ